MLDAGSIPAGGTIFKAGTVQSVPAFFSISNACEVVRQGPRRYAMFRSVLGAQKGTKRKNSGGIFCIRMSGMHRVIRRREEMRVGEEIQPPEPKCHTRGRPQNPHSVHLRQQSAHGQEPAPAERRPADRTQPVRMRPGPPPAQIRTCRITHTAPASASCHR